MGPLRRLHSLFSFASIAPEVLVSQLETFTGHPPIIYIIGNISCVALAGVFFGTAPLWLTVAVPAAFCGLGLYRGHVWRVRRGHPFTPTEARARLSAAALVAGFTGLVYASWALLLFPYGDAYQRCYVGFFLATTMAGGIVCLMHVRPVALMMGTGVAIPFFARFLTTGQPVFATMAAIGAVTAFTTIVAISRYYRDMTNLIQSRVALETLSNEYHRLANVDGLTGLPNRRGFFVETAARIADGGPLVMGLIDLDGFKPVNDVFGHAAGDEVLVEIGRRLRETLGSSMLVARLGGDEFGLVMSRPSDAAEIARQGDIIRRIVREPITLANGTARVAASVGFAVMAPGGSTPDELFGRADYALYAAKAGRLGAAVIFSAQHENAIRTQSLLEQTMRRADLDAEMHLVFQPIVDVARGRTTAYEALARWSSPTLGAVAPLDFIAAAERTGLINHLTEVLFAKALAALKTWPRDIDLSFNLSARDVSSLELIARVGAMIDESGLQPRRIVFELTETALMHDFDQARERLLSLRALGAKIALDDFGTGYSSLNYIHRIPLHKLKVDRTFVAAVTMDQASRDIVKSIVDLCRNLKLTCVVEGVETVEQAVTLRALGCLLMQGFYFGRPMDNAAVLESAARATPDGAPPWLGHDLAASA